MIVFFLWILSDTWGQSGIGIHACIGVKVYRYQGQWECDKPVILIPIQSVGPQISFTCNNRCYYTYKISTFLRDNLLVS